MNFEAVEPLKISSSDLGDKFRRIVLGSSGIDEGVEIFREIEVANVAKSMRVR